MDDSAADSMDRCAVPSSAAVLSRTPSFTSGAAVGRAVAAGRTGLGTSAFYEAFHANFEVVIADTPKLIEEAFALRYQVYCLERAFEDPASNPDGCERDEFDDRSVHALVRHIRSGDCVGAVRLVLADANEPQTAFPIEAHCGGSFYPGVQERVEAVPRTRLAEISRFAVSKQFRRRLAEGLYVHGISPEVAYADSSVDWAEQHRRVMPHVTMGLFAGITRLSRAHGVTHWFAVMEPTLLRLLRQFGIHFPPIGPTVDYHGRRRPTLALAAQIATNVYTRRHDVWEVVTARGKELLSRE